MKSILNMKKKFLVGAFLFILGVGAFSQQAIKFGHVDSQALMAGLPDVATVQKTMEGEYKTLESKLTIMQEDLKKMQDAYIKTAETLAPEARSANEQEIMAASQKVQNFYTFSQQQLKAKEQELYLPIMQKVQKAIDEVGAEQGFIYIFESSVGFTLYHSDKSEDVAPLVKAKLGVK